MKESFKISEKEVKKRVESHVRAKKRQIDKAITAACREGVSIIRRNSPRAFGDLRDSIHTKKHKIIIDAPHAVAVEIGSRPHFIPLEALEKWVRLRHAQRKYRGFLKQGWRVGTTTNRQIASVKAHYAHIAKSNPTATHDDIIKEVAKAIQLSIAEKGTMPHWYARDSLPKLKDSVRKYIFRAVNTPVGK